MKRLIAEGDFKFQFYIEKAIAKEEDEELYLEGIASTLNVDHDNERMSEEALQKMANIINTSTVPLRVEHLAGDGAIIGCVNKAWIDDRKNLWIRAPLEKGNRIGTLLHESLKKGVKLGFSVAGAVKRAVRELSESTGKMVKTFYDVALDEVSVTQKPANYDAWLFAKSIISNKEEAEKMYSSPLYREFLFENPQLDYMQAFAKSIPDKDWKKVAEDENEDMLKNKTKKAEDEVKDEDKEVEKTEDDKEVEKEEEKEEFNAEKSFTALKSMVEKGFNAFATILKEMSSDAKDQENPDEKKDDTEEVAKEMDTPAKDQENPDETKDDTEEVAKEEEGEKDVEKEEEDDGDYGGEYQMDEIGKAVKAVEDIAKKISTVKKSSGAKKIEKSSASMESFATAVSGALSKFHERLEKSGKNIPGLDRMIVDLILNDSSIQKSIREEFSKSSKKSVSFASGPFMIGKDGKRYSLIAKDEGMIEKSKKDIDGKSFKDVYKSEFSSEANGM